MATRLLYQLFIALGKKTKMKLTGAAMETMRPAGPTRLGYIESDMYKEVSAFFDMFHYIMFFNDIIVYVFSTSRVTLRTDKVKKGNVKENYTF